MALSNQAQSHILSCGFSRSKPSKTLLPFKIQSLPLKRKPTLGLGLGSPLTLSISSPIKIHFNRTRRCLFKSYAAAPDSTSTDDVQASEHESSQEESPNLKTLVNVYKQAILDGDSKTASHIEARVSVIENEYNILDGVQASESESNQEEPTSLKTLFNIYKHAILDGDSKIVSDIEARITEIQIEKDILEDVQASESESDEEEPSSLKALIDVYKQAILDGDSKTVSDIEARITIIDNENNILVQKLSELTEEMKSVKEKYIRLQADFDNFRKRTENERLTIRSDAQGEVLENLLPIVDSFERAKQQIKPETEKEKKIDTSYQGIYKLLEDIMRSLKVTAIATVGEPFDPSLHEAIAQEESQEFGEGIIIEEFRRGFVLGDRLLRPAMVKISAGPGSESAQVATDESTGQPATADGVEQ